MSVLSEWAEGGRRLPVPLAWAWPLRSGVEGEWWGSRAEAREMMRTGWSGVGRQGVAERVEVEGVGEEGGEEEGGGRKGEGEVMLTRRLCGGGRVGG